MPQLPHKLIREVQISTRAAARLPEYDPSDRSLPSLPPLSAAIAASDSSAPNLRCKNCKGTLLRGTESIICLYCGHGPHYDAVPEDICFIDTIGYQWLLRSLRLDGSEMVDLSEKTEQNISQSLPRSLTCLSEFLNFKIPWPVETEKQETNSDSHSEEGKRSLSFPGVAPDTFFLKSNSNAISDVPFEQPSDHHTEAAARKESDDQDLFRNVRSSEPAFSSSVHKTDEALSGWEADFQSADSGTEHVDNRSTEHVVGSLADSGIKFPDPESFQSSSSDFGVKFPDPESFQSLSADFGTKFQDAESFQSLSADFGTKFQDAESFQSSSADFGTKFQDPEFFQSSSVDSGIKSQNPELFQSSSADFEMKFQEPELFQTSSADSGIKFQDPEPFHSSSGQEVDLSAHFDSVFGPVANLKDEKPKEGQAVSPAFDEWNSNDTWNSLSSSEPNFSGGFDTDFISSKEPRNDHTLGQSIDNSTTDDLFQDFQFQTNTDMINNKITNEEHRMMDEDLFDDWEDFTGSTSSQVPPKNASPEVNDQGFTHDEKSERDLFSFDNKIEEDFGDFSQANFFSSSTSNSKAPTEVDAIMPENPASMLTDEDASGQSTKDDVKTLISEMHDLSFMLQSDLSIPSGSDAANSSKID